MNARVNAFANLTEPPEFQPKPKPETSKPAVPKEALERIAKENNFPSRQAKKEPSTPKRKPRIYRTGRNRHFGLRATNDTVERFYKAADERGVPLGRLLELALDALERAGE